MRRAALIGAAALAALALGTMSPARALNKDAMRNILATVYLAQNFTAVCGKIDPDFGRDAGGREADAVRAITHIKDEILAVMTRDEAAPIVTSAADAARAVGLGMIRQLSGGEVEEQQARVKALCEATAKPLVKGVVENHEERHEFFEKMLRDARQG